MGMKLINCRMLELNPLLFNTALALQVTLVDLIRRNPLIFSCPTSALAMRRDRQASLETSPSAIATTFRDQTQRSIVRVTAGRFKSARRLSLDAEQVGKSNVTYCPRRIRATLPADETLKEAIIFSCTETAGNITLYEVQRIYCCHSEEMVLPQRSFKTLVDYGSK